MGFQLLILVLYPTLIAPLFNKFTPMVDNPAPRAHRGTARALRLPQRGPLRDGRLQALRPRQCVFHRLRQGQAHRVLRHAADATGARGGRGRARARARPLQARHVAKRIAWSAVLSLAILALLALARAMRRWFYVGLGIPEAMLPVALTRPGVALELFLLALPVFTFLLEPLSSLYSRQHEFEADAFATAACLRAGAGRSHSSSCTRTTPPRSRPIRCTRRSTIRIRRRPSGSRGSSCWRATSRRRPAA